jgi:preprotein translocase subunit SecG
MTYEPLNRRLAILATIFAILGVILAIIALATNYWTVLSVSEPVNNGTMFVGERQNVHMWNVSIGEFSFAMTLALASDEFR